MFFDFNVDYDGIAVDDILGIHKYLMKKKMDFIKCFFYSSYIF